MTRGIFIALEGIDASGTTTQAKRLKDAMEQLGRRVYQTEEPSKSKVGKVLRDFLSGTSQNKHLPQAMALMFAADRLLHLDEEIVPQLEAGFDVISDRYVMSSLVYQGLNLPDQWVSQLNQYAKVPDLTMVLDLGEADAQSRLSSRSQTREMFDSKETQVRLRKRYLKLAESHRAAIVDGSGDVEVVTTRLMEIVRRRLTA